MVFAKVEYGGAGEVDGVNLPPSLGEEGCFGVVRGKGYLFKLLQRGVAYVAERVRGFVASFGRM